MRERGTENVKPRRGGAADIHLHTLAVVISSYILGFSWLGFYLVFYKLNRLKRISSGCVCQAPLYHHVYRFRCDTCIHTAQTPLSPNLPLCGLTGVQACLKLDSGVVPQRVSTSWHPASDTHWLLLSKEKYKVAFQQSGIECPLIISITQIWLRCERPDEKRTH